MGGKRLDNLLRSSTHAGPIHCVGSRDRNYNNYCDPEMTKLFEAQSREIDQEKRLKMVWDIDRKLQEDIARRKQVEEQLRESEEQLRATFEQAAVGIAHTAPDGRFLMIMLADERAVRPTVLFNWPSLSESAR